MELVEAVRNLAARLYGEELAEAIPPEGAVGVHRYLTIELGGRRIAIDATFPGAPWDGCESKPLACGLGEDCPAGSDPDAEKRQLEAEHRDPAAREPFIEALANSSGPARHPGARQSAASIE